MYTVYKVTSFESAHLLEGHPKCGKLHGHSYKCEFWITSKSLTEPYNFVIDFHTLSDIAKSYDHNDLVISLSCEALAREIALEVANSIEGDAHIKVRLWETATSYAEYEMEANELTP